MNFGMRFLDLLERSVIVQAFLPIMFGGTCCVMWGMGYNVPEALLNLTYICVAFWMGAKAQHVVDAKRQSRYDH